MMVSPEVQPAFETLVFDCAGSQPETHIVPESDFLACRGLAGGQSWASADTPEKKPFGYVKIIQNSY